jgi:hypothetical protein
MNNNGCCGWRTACLAAGMASWLVVGGLGLADERETLPADLKVVGLEVRPERIELSHPYDYRQLLVTGRLASGETADLTRIAQAKEEGGVVSISSDGLVRPRAEGQGRIVLRYEGYSAEVPVTVRGLTEPYRVSFVQDVQPVLSRMGCNAGTCHGAKEGKAGFKLSLRGYDPLFDHRALTDDIGARRFNRAAPDQSLMLLKATGSIPHVGGVRTEVGSPYYNLVRDWIAQGVKLDLEAPRVQRIEVYPANPIVPRPGMKQQVMVLATYSDGRVRDVTREAFIESGNIEVIEANATGVLTTLRRGEAPVLVRYEGAYAATTIICMGDRTGFVWRPQPQFNYIDELVDRKLQAVKVLPSGLCTDEEFVRRVYLDLTGLPPTAEQVRQFLADPRPSRTRREALIDQLLGSRAYVEHWTNKWADLLQVNRKFLGEEGAAALRNWIQQRIAENQPYDQFVREILTASGSNLENPAAGYWKILRDPAQAMENTTHLFLAIRFNCNKCHDHPFERWTQDQYYHLAQFFAQVGRKEEPQFAGKKLGGTAVEGAVPLVEVIYDTGSGDVKHDRTGQVVPPAFPYSHRDLPPAEAARRQQLAHWITSPENPYFARSYVNRLWGYLLGVGIIEPIDDIRAGNPPTNPELLDALTRDFIASGFNVQHILRTICSSRVYQQSVATNAWNEDDTINYSHAIPRRLPAEALYDAIHLATGATEKLPGLPPGFRAAQLPDAGVSVPFLDDFGKPVRESSCECERSSGIVLGPVLKLVNGPTVAEALADPTSELNRLAASDLPDDKLIEEVFLRFLARFPTAREVELGLAALQAARQDLLQAQQALAAYEATLPQRQAAWEASLRGPVEWQPLKAVSLASAAGATLTQNDQAVITATGNLAKDVYTIVAECDLPRITGLRIEALSSPELPSGGPGRAPNGNFVLSELKVTQRPAREAIAPQPVALASPSADFSQQGWPVSAAIDGNEQTGWAVHPQFGKSHEAIFELAEPIAREGGTQLTLTLSQQYPDGKHLLGAFRISVTGAEPPLARPSLPQAVAAALAVPRDQRSAEQLATIAAYYRSQDSELAQLAQAAQNAQQQLQNARALGVQDLAWALINTPAFLFNR